MGLGRNGNGMVFKVGNLNLEELLWTVVEI